MSFDDLVRGAGENARSNIATAFKLDEHDLYRELGIHSRDLAVTGIAPLSADDFPRGRSSKLEDSELSTLGRQIFRRWCASLHELVCGTDAEDNDLRQQILHVISGSKETLAAVISGILVTAFGTTPIIAALVAALLIKIVITPAGDRICAFWSERLKNHCTG